MSIHLLQRFHHFLLRFAHLGSSDFLEELLDLLRHKQKTVIFVTHSIEEAAYLSDQIVLLSPRPGTVSKIIQPNIERAGRNPDEIRRDKNYLDVVEEIWQILKHYVV